MSVKARTLYNGKIGIIDIKGSLIGNEETDSFKEAVADFLEQGIKNLVINLQKVNYVNSSGIGAIISAHTSYAKSGGKVMLAGISNTVQSVLVITKLIDVFDVFDTVDEAVESFVQV
ncbi:MAG: STAS domain-containing protein [Ignavibacteriae bacterium]|nr:STAS domain-containing protein [Ignavibacteriota bacterium]